MVFELKTIIIESHKHILSIAINIAFVDRFFKLNSVEKNFKVYD